MPGLAESIKIVILFLFLPDPAVSCPHVQTVKQKPDPPRSDVINKFLE